MNIKAIFMSKKELNEMNDYLCEMDDVDNEIKQNVLYNIEQVTSEIFEMKNDDPDLTYLECVISYAEENEISIVEIKDLLSQSLLLKIEEECENLNLIKKESKVDI